MEGRTTFLIRTSTNTKLFYYTSFYRVDYDLQTCRHFYTFYTYDIYLLVTFHDDRSSRTCWTKKSVILDRPSANFLLLKSA